MKTALILSSGKCFFGESFGLPAPDIDMVFSSEKESQKNTAQKQMLFSHCAGELVFNTAMSGYVEVMSDPSFSGQIICMTYPHIGNYGVDRRWSESGSEMMVMKDETSHKGIRKAILCSGLVVSTLYKGPIPEGRISLDDWMKEEGLCGISGVDTRALTLYLRDNGNENAMILSIDDEHKDEAIGRIQTLLAGMPDMEGSNIVKDIGLQEDAEVIPRHPSIRNNTNASVRHNTNASILRVGILDCGCKHTIVSLLEERNCEVLLCKEHSSVEDILSKNLDMLMLSNGPGDPSVLLWQQSLIQSLIGQMSIAGICLGMQLLALSIGAKTYKLPFGHHGINHPVKDMQTNKLYITSQNHGFAVDIDTLPHGAVPWFMNTNDNTLAGFIYPEKHIYCVQFHPEASPGPTDTFWIIDYFIEKALQHKKTGAL